MRSMTRDVDDQFLLFCYCIYLMSYSCHALYVILSLHLNRKCQLEEFTKNPLCIQESSKLVIVSCGETTESSTPSPRRPARGREGTYKRTSRMNEG